MWEELTFALRQLADETRAVRTINLAPLSDLPRSEMERFRQAWLGLSPRRRVEVVSTMVEQAEANIHLNFHTILRECLHDADYQVRRLAIEGLWEDERCSLIAPLVNLLAEDSSAEVRAAAAASLGRFVLLGVLGEIAESYAQQAEAALRAAWQRPHEVNEVRRRVLEALAYSNAPYVREMIDSAYYDEDELMRQSAVFAMGRSADPYWAKIVLHELQSRDAAMRFEAAVAAGELALTDAVQRLIQMLDDVDSNVREAAAISLGKIGGPEAKRALEAVAEGDDERLAEAAEEALEELAFNSDTLDYLMMEYTPGREWKYHQLADKEADEEDFYGDEYFDEFDEEEEDDLDEMAWEDEEEEEL
jgi:hypothetical protein